MSTTLYLTSFQPGAITITAAALGGPGNIPSEQFTVTMNPLPTLPKCYNAILALSPSSDSVESACAQFGVANTYYLGNPRNTVYLDDGCSNVVSDGYYKTEDNNWVNINGGSIRQRGECSAVGRIIPQRDTINRVKQETQNVELSIPARQPREVKETFVQTPTFTPPSPTVTPPDPEFVSERRAAKAAQKTPDVPQTDNIVIQTTSPEQPVIQIPLEPQVTPVLPTPPEPVVPPVFVPGIPNGFNPEVVARANAESAQPAILRGQDTGVTNQQVITRTFTVNPRTGRR